MRRVCCRDVNSVETGVMTEKRNMGRRKIICCGEVLPINM